MSTTKLALTNVPSLSCTVQPGPISRQTSNADASAKVSSVPDGSTLTVRVFESNDWASAGPSEHPRATMQMRTESDRRLMVDLRSDASERIVRSS